MIDEGSEPFCRGGGVSFATHDGSNSHIDPLCHYVGQSMPDNPTLYNGKPQNLTGNGCEGGASIDKMGQG